MTDPLLTLADTPPTSVSSDATVREAVTVMSDASVGAVAVIDDGNLVGIFTERDLMRRVINEGRNTDDTTVGEVMVRDPVSVRPDTKRQDALDLMLEHHFRHLPVTGDDGKPIGMLSIRNLLHDQVRQLREDVESLEHYLAADGPGG